MNRLSPASPPPRWMRGVLLSAGVYNLVWGAWVVLRPMDLFRLTATAEPIYPSIWQCVGMIVGVYGIGYLIAAGNPLRHWPIVLVGFLGKTFGPIGMLFHWLTVPADASGRLPITWGWINVTNDLIWWIPFAAILYHAFRQANAPASVSDADGDADSSVAHSVAELNGVLHSQLGNTIAELSVGRDVMVVFLRHSGCTFCREALQDIGQVRQEIESSGRRIVLVHMGDNEADAEMFSRYGLDDVDRISDPTCRLYRAYRLPRGGFSELLGVAVWWRGFQAAILDRHGVGKLGGDGFQMPGVFVVRDNRIKAEYRHATAASRPDYCELADSAERPLSLG